MLNNANSCSLRTWDWWNNYPREEDVALKYLIAKAKTLGRLPTLEEAWTYECRQIMGRILHRYSNYDEAVRLTADQSFFEQMYKSASPAVQGAISALGRLVKHYKDIPTRVQVDLYRKYHEAEGAMTYDSLVRTLGPTADWGRMVDPSILRQVGIAGQ